MFTSDNKSKNIKEFNQFVSTQVIKKLNSRFDGHSVFLTRSGHVYTRGQNNDGQLGLRDFITRYRSAEHVMPHRVLGLENIIDIEIGVNYTLCLNDRGQVFSFGRNAYGQLGLGDKKDRPYPCPIAVLENRKIISMKTNSCVSYFLDDQGIVYACGFFYTSAHLGIGDINFPATLPTSIPNLPAIKAIIPCGGDRLFLLDYHGNVYACGENTKGQLGLDSHDKKVFKPVKLKLPPIKKVGGENEFTYFLTETGEVYSCGNGVAEPYRRPELNNHFSFIVDMYNDEHCSCFLVENGDVFIFFDKPRHENYDFSESTDFTEFNIPIPEEIKYRIKDWRWLIGFTLGPFKYEKDSAIALACQRNFAHLNREDFSLRNKLLVKYRDQPELISYIKMAESQEGEAAEVKSTLLSTFSLINVKRNEAPKQLMIPTDITDYVNSLNKQQECMRRVGRKI